MAQSAISMNNGVYRRRHLVNKVMLTISLGALLFGLFWLFWIIATLLVRARPRCRSRCSRKLRPRPGRPAACSTPWWAAC